MRVIALKREIVRFRFESRALVDDDGLSTGRMAITDVDWMQIREAGIKYATWKVDVAWIRDLETDIGVPTIMRMETATEECKGCACEAFDENRTCGSPWTM